jgi:methylase of polypeptide subunit release factors
MMQFTPDSSRALEALAERLRGLGYSQAVRQLCGDRHVSRYRLAMRDLRDAARPDGLDDRVWAVVSLLFLGQPWPREAVRQLLAIDLDPLIAIGMLSMSSEDGAVRCARCGLLPLRDGLFLVSRLRTPGSEPGSNAAYFGLDTLELIDEALASPAAATLEVGCGGGIVGILGRVASPSRRMVGVDLCEEAIEIARVNAALNGVAYDGRVGDLYDPIGDERFDLILADPPCVAVPDDLAFPIYGDGGRHGDRLLRRIVARAGRHLTPGGRLFAVTELQCTPGDIPFLRWLRRWCARAPGRWARVELLASRHLPPDYHQSLGDNLDMLPGGGAGAPKIGSQFAHYAAAQRLYFGYWIRLRAGVRAWTAKAEAEAEGCEIAWRFPRATPRSRVLAQSGTLTADVERLYRQTATRFDPAFRWFLEQAPHGRSLADLGRTLGSAGEARQLTAYFVDVATALRQLGVVDLDHVRRVS